jgi:methyl-accepting chemotaxis protein
VKLVGETGEALQRIAVQITGINRLMNQMATSASEQATGIEQVNAAVASMDQATQQNAAMVEESTAATRALADEGRGLAAVMGRFRLAGFDTRAGQLAA